MLSALRTTPLPVILLLASLICPSELSVFAGTVRLPPHRLVIILMCVAAGIKFIMSKPFRVRSFDVLFLFYAIWLSWVFVHHEGMADGIQFGGALALESFGTYFIMRVYVRDLPTFRSTLTVLFMTVLAVGAIALPEAIFKQHFVHDTLYKLTGYYHPTGEETRLGLMRAYSTFDHPIHYGTFCASAFALMWFSTSSRGRQIVRSGLIAACTFLGLSSAPMLCVMTQVALSIWDYVTRNVAHRFAIIGVVIVVGYVVMSMLSDRAPIFVLISNFTLDPWTGFYRTQIWLYGMENVYENPWTGIGLGDWKRVWWMVSPSIDAFWLVIMMRAGVPALVMLLAAMALLIAGVHKSRHAFATFDIDRIKKGWTIALLALSLAACTVHYWNAIHAYFFFFLGLAGWLADPRYAAASTAPEGQRNRRRTAPHADRRQPTRPIAPGPRPANGPAYGNQRPVGGPAYAFRAPPPLDARRPRRR